MHVANCKCRTSLLLNTESSGLSWCVGLELLPQDRPTSSNVLKCGDHKLLKIWALYQMKIVRWARTVAHPLNHIMLAELGLMHDHTSLEYLKIQHCPSPNTSLKPSLRHHLSSSSI
ncbi:hypothetical protein VitviT2T_020043 [Vitis vinifera]|uniref:Uncharacterized protein n=1 Tax=Vitis vinifera TaxID=29760 RepID=A0ABY9D2E8_VITVI|nr:hypothetical protein VitviT2T_020043 [Vitis vinifera]